MLSRHPWLLLPALLACDGTGPGYPPFDGSAPVVSHSVFTQGAVSAIVRDPQGAVTIGRTDYTYVFFSREGSTDGPLSFASEWTWTQVDGLTWRVTVPVAGSWSVASWHVADEDANVKLYQCPSGSTCVAAEVPVNPSVPQ